MGFRRSSRSRSRAPCVRSACLRPRRSSITAPPGPILDETSRTCTTLSLRLCVCKEPLTTRPRRRLSGRPHPVRRTPPRASPGTVRRVRAPVDRSGGSGVRRAPHTGKPTFAKSQRSPLPPRPSSSVVASSSDVRSEQKTWTSDDLREFFAAVAEDRLYAAFAPSATAI